MTVDGIANTKEESELGPEFDLSSLVLGSNDSLFRTIEESQISSARPFGTFLDAGTGSHSLRWIASLVHSEERAKRLGKSGIAVTKEEKALLSVERFVAVTADKGMQKIVQEEAENMGLLLNHRDNRGQETEKGKVVVGNWAAEKGGDMEICAGEKFDTILADYLVGAIDGFSPYFQDQIFPCLATKLNSGGRIYVVGLNPIPDKVEGDADIFCRVTKLRDACILLAGHRCYREYPVDWIQRHLELSGLTVVGTSKFPIMYSHTTIMKQLNVARSKLRLFRSKGLADEMGKAIDELEQESKTVTGNCPKGFFKLGFDYVVTAEKPL